MDRIAQAKRVNIADKHIEENIKADRGRTTTLFASCVDVEGIGETSKRTGDAGKPCLEGIKKGKARSIETEGGKCITEAIIGNSVVGFRYIRGEDVDGRLVTFRMFEEEVEGCGGSVRRLARTGTALGIREDAPHTFADGGEALVKEGGD